MKLKEDYTKKSHSNPFNWNGGKHRYLKDLFEVLPEDENVIVIDPFVGGGDLISKLPNSWSVLASDAMPQLIEMHQAIKAGLISVDSINAKVRQFDLSKTGDLQFETLKSCYNAIKTPQELYALICHSNSNRIRFNNSGDFNVQFGDRTFNSNMQEKLRNYSGRLNEMDIRFRCESFNEINFNMADLILIDPPYLNTTATYNERAGWTINDELELLTKTRKASDAGVKFVYFGQIWSKGVNNPHLEAWSKQFNVKVLKDTTKHCSSNRNPTGKTIEVMIYN